MVDEAKQKVAKNDNLDVGMGLESVLWHWIALVFGFVKFNLLPSQHANPYSNI